VRLKLVPGRLCTDNAAMIGSAARFAPRLEYPTYLAYDAFASGETPVAPAPAEPAGVPSAERPPA
jgi:hypothetical protein